jgi:LDH2 family malate/lactate/ureidoglycolate dehydrogenase
MKISITKLQESLVRKAEVYVDHESAKYLAKQTIKTHLRKSPRVNPLKSTIKALQNREKFPDVEITTTSVKVASVQYNFNGKAPLVSLHEIHQRAKQLATKSGIAIIAINNSAGLHALNIRVE